MKVAFSQVYLREDAQFPFSVHFQRLLTELVSELVDSSDSFVAKYGDKAFLGFNVSAKHKEETEIRGPSVPKGHYVVEFTIFLPHPAIVRHVDLLRETVRRLLDAVMTVLDKLKINTVRLKSKYNEIIETIAAAPGMFKS